MADERDELPVLMVTDQDSYLIAVGDPSTFGGRDLSKYLKEGYKINTVKFKEYRAMNLKWIYSKPKKPLL